MVKHRNAGDPSSNLGGPITITYFISPQKKEEKNPWQVKN